MVGEIAAPADATWAEIDAAVVAAEAAAAEVRRVPAMKRAAFLRAIGRQIEALGDALIEWAMAETNLPRPRLLAERGRTVGQLNLFAQVIEEGSWVEARIDRAMPGRKPMARPDLRRMLIPLGPAAVFAASNFPFAFSVAGGDTASALAAGNPVIVKAHPGHPATSERTAGAVRAAAAECAMPAGIFSILYGKAPDVSVLLVQHPLLKAVGFTGSLKAGRALFNAAASRPEPIPVYAEMGSVNPLFVLPGAMRDRAAALAAGLQMSATLGVGQFCTQPGIVVLPGGDEAEREAAGAFLKQSAQLWNGTAAGTMLYPGIHEAYRKGVERLETTSGVRTVARGADGGTIAQLFNVDAATFLSQPHLSDEVFGPATLAVSCGSKADMLEVARNLAGHLTATVHGTEADWAEYRELVEVLETKVGRLVINGFPTGVEVCHAMNHGGPYPATTDVRSTSVGSAAITRFARPICWQDMPAALLPEDLWDANPRGIWRLVDGEWTRGPC